MLLLRNSTFSSAPKLLCETYDTFLNGSSLVLTFNRWAVRPRTSSLDSASGMGGGGGGGGVC